MRCRHLHVDTVVATGLVGPWTESKGGNKSERWPIAEALGRQSGDGSQHARELHISVHQHPAAVVCRTQQSPRRVVPHAFSLCLRDEPRRDVAWSSLAGEETARAYLRKAPALLTESGEFLQRGMASIVALLDGDVNAAKKVREPHTVQRSPPDACPTVHVYRWQGNRVVYAQRCRLG